MGNKQSIQYISTGKGLLALSPIVVFLLLYVVVSVIIGDFYKMPLSIAFIVASMWALLCMPKMKIAERINIFSKGAANGNVLYMIWIFFLAGAFSALAKGIGAIDATVNLALASLPSTFIVPGLFITACFISMSIGTSVGTIVALTPFACQLAQSTGADTAFLVSVVLGGSFFGDNLSFISDTTIAATRSQKVKMNDKFKTNLWIALPAALITLGVYIATGNLEGAGHAAFSSASWWHVLPYLIVIVAAVIGVNVLIVLTLGIFACIAIALCGLADTSLIEMCGFMGDGIRDMSDLIIVTLLAAGLLGVISHNGGVKYIIQVLTRRIDSSRGAQAVIALLVSLVNLCTANNTIAIITVGDIAHKISQQFHLDGRKVASLLDTCSCIVQCLIPYGAQSLMAAGLAHLSPVAFLPYLYYTWALAAIVTLSILLNLPHHRKKQKK
ncbi:MAG: Na+/H+ antiporter NhaC family protein [Bacteroidales bacterium]|nr:Na+/H+ antiporter NhaC family protein [Bacteroidales bacterium]